MVIFCTSCVSIKNLPATAESAPVYQANLSDTRMEAHRCCVDPNFAQLLFEQLLHAVVVDGVLGWQ